jgi:hypothetical protein
MVMQRIFLFRRSRYRRIRSAAGVKLSLSVLRSSVKADSQRRIYGGSNPPVHTHPLPFYRWPARRGFLRTGMACTSNGWVNERLLQKQIITSSFIYSMWREKSSVRVFLLILDEVSSLHRRLVLRRMRNSSSSVTTRENYQCAYLRGLSELNSAIFANGRLLDRVHLAFEPCELRRRSACLPARRTPPARR